MAMADQETDDEDGNVLAFAGLTRFNTETDLPDAVWGHSSSMKWWASERRGEEADGVEDLPDAGLSTRINQLPRATAVEAGWRHPVTGEWVSTGKHNAVVNAETVEDLTRFTDMSEGPDGYAGTRDEADEMLDAHPHVKDYNLDNVTVGDDALFNIPTDDYEIINPSQFLRPLAEVLQDEGLDDAVFGEFRLSRGGGRVSADVFFNGKHVNHPDMDEDRKPIVVGMQLDWDFFGDTALRIQGMGMDYECVNAIRSITDTRIVKHAGDVESRVEWKSLFRQVLEDIDLKVDQLAQLIQKASEQSLDVSDLPDDFAEDYDSVLEAFYAYAGLPDYLASHAADNLRAEAADPFAPNWWEIHRGATYAVSHHARGEVGTGGSIEQYHRTANDMLMQGEEFEDRVAERYREAREDREGTLEGEGGGIAQIQQAFTDTREKAEQFRERDDQIREQVRAFAGDAADN